MTIFDWFEDNFSNLAPTQIQKFLFNPPKTTHPSVQPEVLFSLISAKAEVLFSIIGAQTEVLFSLISAQVQVLFSIILVHRLRFFVHLLGCEELGVGKF